MAATVLVVAAMAGLNIARFELPPGTVWLSVVGAAALLGFARWSGLSWAQLGFGRDRLRSGAAWGAAAVLVVGAVYLAGVLLPATRSAFLDSKYHLAVPQALVTAFVVIPLGTVLLEEVAFRSVLWGMLTRHMGVWRVLVASSLTFGFWHVLPAMSSAHHSSLAGTVGVGAGATVLLVLATVAFTTLGGVVAGELRRRSGSVLASAGMHWATNALGVLFGIIAWRLAA